jgi:CRP-like cAMP-binding protein
MPVDRELLPAFLEMLGPSSRAATLAAAQTMRLPKGAVLFRHGEAGGGLYEVAAGKVKLSRLPGESPEHPANRHESLLLLVGPGQLFGELAAFDGGPRSATAVAVTPVVVRYYAPAALDTLIRAHVDVGYAILRHVTYRLRFTLERTHDIQVHDRSVRLAKAILLLSQRFGERRGGYLVVRHDLTQGELGGLTGLSRETVSKVLAELAAQGLVRNRSGQVVILDEEGLRAIAGSS